MATKKKAEQAEVTTQEPLALTVVKVDLDKNIPQELCDELTGAFFPIYRQMQDLEAEYEAITGSDVTVHTNRISKQARELRLKYKSLRGVKGLKGVHEEKKEFYRSVGNAIDALEREGRLAALAREEKLEEIEKFHERQLQETRAEELQPYLFEGQEMRTDLGTMNEDDWEIVFMGQRAKFQEAGEKEAKRVLREARLKEAAKYSLYIDSFEEVVWEDFSEKEFKALMETSKGLHESQEKKRIEAEAEAKRLQEEADAREAAHKAELEAKAAEEGARQRKFSSRVASVSGGTLKEDGIYYKDKRICTMKSLQEKPDEEFNAFLQGHLERYSADVQAEADKKAKEEEARKAQLEEAARVAAENAKLKAEKDAIEKTRKEAEEKMAAQRAEAEAKKGAPDKEKLKEFRGELANLGYPDCVSAEARKTVNGVQTLIGKVIGYIDEKLEKL